ncbi:hypothetical protein ACFO9E_32770 [Streptomyces maoxianensis]|uniref:Histidine kinase/HSP90-like ATPase domain-containing protein n=1 Tax=Streptomyces maoxianensis TaxID=1459942 RepID=A0ABV9GIS5_9ACTN
MTLVPAALPEVAATAALTAAFVAAPILLRSRRLLTGLRAERDAAVQETARIGARCGALKEETQHLVAVAELLANAVHHSHGTLSVDVSLHQAESGVCIVIDDAGVGMHQDEVEFATRRLPGRHWVQLTELGDPPRAPGSPRSAAWCGSTALACVRRPTCAVGRRSRGRIHTGPFAHAPRSHGTLCRDRAGAADARGDAGDLGCLPGRHSVRARRHPSPSPRRELSMTTS